MFDGIKRAIGRGIAHFLTKEIGVYTAFSVTSARQLAGVLRPGDILLVEGHSRISTAIKYLTQSTWSHAAFFVGHENEGAELIEADLKKGVHTIALTDLAGYNSRICRPVGLTPQEIDGVIAYMRGSLGHAYDLRNVVDLARYLLPKPPVPRRWRRRMLAMGSGDPTRAICSTLIAEAYQKVNYPILPFIERDTTVDCRHEILHIRHHSLFAPRDFDLSPFFRIVKPTIETGFDPHALIWADTDGDGRVDA